MDKAGLNNFKPEIEDLLLDIEKEAVSSYNRKSAKKENKNETNKITNDNSNLNNKNEDEDILIEKDLIKNE
jgi:hypothetical protein